jgi:hypothetical protein
VFEKVKSQVGALGSHPHAPPVFDRPSKRFRLHHGSIIDPDDNSLLYMQSLMGVIPKTANELLQYMATTSIQKLPLSLELHPIPLVFDSFIQNGCVVVDQDCECHIFVDLLSSFFTYHAEGNRYISEMEFTPLVNFALAPISILLRKPIARNCQSTTTRTKLPNFLLCDGPLNTPIMLGEDKTYVNYQKGTKDPIVDLEEKAPWDSWEMFYGTLPYYFAYSCLGGPTAIDLQVGIMDKASRKFVPLFSHDICKRECRGQFSLDLFKLLPVVKAVSMHLRQIKGRVWEVVKHLPHVTTTVSILIIQNAPVFKKEWLFRSNDQREEFRLRLGTVFERINSLPDSVLLMKLQDTLHVPPRSNSLRGYFVPFGNYVYIHDEASLLNVVISLARSLRVLHGAGIVHNDIRWDNVMESGGRFFFIDFDEAFVLTDESPWCPPLLYLSTHEHSPKSFEDHKYEVDCWALGRLILTRDIRAQLTPKTRKAAQSIVDQCPESVEVVISILEELQMEEEVTLG